MNDLSPYRASAPAGAAPGPRWYQLVARFRAWRAARAAARHVAERARLEASRRVWVDGRSGFVRVSFLGDGAPFSDNVLLRYEDLPGILRHLRSDPADVVCVTCWVYGHLVFVPSPWREDLAGKLDAVIRSGVR